MSRVFEAITKHAGLVIVIWIIIALLSAPAAMKVNEVTEFNAERMLPNGTESMQASQLLANITGKGASGLASMSYDVILVQGVDTRDKKLLQWDREFNDSVKPYVEEYMSPYKIVNEALDEIKPDILNASKNIYDAVNTTVEKLIPLYENRYLILDKLNETTKMLHMFKQMAMELYKNHGEMERAAKMLVDNSTSFKEMYIQACMGYNKSIEELGKLKDLYKLVDAMLVAGDQYYSTALAMEPQVYSNITMMKEILETYNKLYYNTTGEYTRLVYDVIRAYYLVKTQTNAFTTTLTQEDIEKIMNLTIAAGDPLSPEVIMGTYYYIITHYPDPQNLTDRDLFIIAHQLFITQASQMIPPEQLMTVESFLGVYNNILYNVSMTIAKTMNTASLGDPLIVQPITGQNIAKQILFNAANAALEPTVTIYAEQAPIIMAEKGIIPENTVKLFQQILLEAYEIGYPVTTERINEVIMNTMTQVMMSMSPDLPPTVAKTYIETLLEKGPTGEASKESLKVLLNEVFPTIGDIPERVYNTIMKLDPDGTGLFTQNPTATKAKVLEILSGFTKLPEIIIEQIIAGDNETIKKIAVQLLREKIVEMTNDPNLGVIADIVAEEQGKPTLQGFQKLFTIMFTAMSRQMIQSLAVNETQFPMTELSVPEPIIRYLATNIWYNNLTVTTAEKILLGIPIASIAYEMNKNMTEAQLIETVLGSSIVNSIVNNTFPETPDKYIVEDLVRIMGDKTISLPEGMSSQGKDSMEKLLYKLLELPENPSPIQIAEAISDIVEIPVETTGNFTVSVNETMVKDVIVRILGKGEYPVNVVVDEFIKYAPSNIDKGVLYQGLMESLSMKDYKPLYDKMISYVEEEIMDKVLDRFYKLMISPDNRTFIILIKPKGDNIDAAGENALQVLSVAKKTLLDAGIYPSYVGITGDHVLAKEMKESSLEDMEKVRQISIIAPLVIALILIGGFVAAGLPFIGIGAAYLLSIAIVTLLGQLGIINVTSWSRMLMITTAFGLGVDYSSYLILRFKEDVAKMGAKKAAYVALKQTYPAIMAAASTSIIGYAVMLLAYDFPLLSGIGETIPFAVLAILLASLTLTPALLAKFGDKKWFWWPHKIESGESPWRGYEMTKKKALALILVSLAVLGIGAYGLATYQGSHDYSVFMPEGKPGYEAYVKLQQLFPAGEFMPVYVVGVAKNSVWDNTILEAIKDLAEKIKEIPGVDEVYSPVNPGAKPKEYYVSDDNKTFMLEVVIKPSSISREGLELTKKIRDLVHSIQDDHFEKLLVGGISAVDLEMEELLNRDFWYKIFPVGIVLMWIAMGLSFMSIWVGIIALASIAAGYMIGVSMASWIPGLYGQPALWFLPLMTFPAVLGVGMDYNSFFMNRVREELDKMKGRDGYRATTMSIKMVSHLVIGLGLIVAVTYASLIIGSSWGIREIGLALSIGVITTTLLSAIVLTPAIMALMGRKAWWPYSKRWKTIENS